MCSAVLCHSSFFVSMSSGLLALSRHGCWASLRGTNVTNVTIVSGRAYLRCHAFARSVFAEGSTSEACSVRADRPSFTGRKFSLVFSHVSMVCYCMRISRLGCRSVCSCGPNDADNNSVTVAVSNQLRRTEKSVLVCTLQRGDGYTMHFGP